MDKLGLTVRSLQAGHLYIFSIGPDGRLQQLFPNSMTLEPRIEKNGSWKLPPGPVVFEASEPPGVSRLLVMVSRWPRSHAELSARVEGPVTTYSVSDDAAIRVARSPGKLPLIAGRPRCPPGPPCVDQFGAVTTWYEAVR